MLVSAAMASSSTSRAFEYDVFISFSGEDTRNGFTSHLRNALREKKIKTFNDDKELKRGDEISKALKKAIEMSKLYVIVFSKTYASSSWCLDELVHILECRSKYDQTVLPIFYGIDPSVVRQQKGSYKSPFAIHEERFENNRGKVQKWRDALKEAADLAGWDSTVIRDESVLVNKIVQAVLSKMSQAPSSDDFKGLVGITKRISQIDCLMRTASSLDEVLKVGIWGSGGIGKTTLARVVFDRLAYKFESSCFLTDIREGWEKGQKHDLKVKLFSQLLKEKNPDMGTLSVGATYDKDRLRRKKVFIVLDDVDKSEQLDFLTEDYIWFGPGSMVIVTTRDMQVIRGEVNKIYKVERLNNEEALQLFQSNAFKRTLPTKKLLHLSERVVNYSEGVPLVLKVLGSSLRGKEPENWEEVLDQLKECPDPNILKLLRVSYDGLNRAQKCIFLDIACFYKGMRRDYTERILDACGLFPKSGIDDLIDKSLIIVKDDNILWMHDLVQEMGWEIEKSIEELRRRTRLWNPEDVYNVLATDIGTATIEGIVLDMSNINEVHFNLAAFQNMHKLRVLNIFYSNKNKKCKVNISPRDCDLQFLPNSLRFLHWEGYPWKSFPSSFRPRYLVEINMPYSKVSKLWKGSLHLPNLKKIDLSNSKNLTRLPDLSQASKLEHVYLEYCTSLQEVPSYIQHLNELRTLFLEGCSSIREFPMVSKSIVCLVLSGTEIERVPSSIEHLSCLETLSLNYCRKLDSLPNISKLILTLKAVTLEGTSLVPSPHNSPWWTTNRIVHSPQSPCQLDQTSSFKTCARKQYRLIPSLKDVIPFIELPRSAFYKGSHMYVEIVSVSTKDLGLQKIGFDHNKNYLASEYLFYNCSRFCRRDCREVKSVRKLQLLSRKIELQEFNRVCHVKGSIGASHVGMKIPKWFHYQSSQNRVVIELPPNSLNSNFLGFAVCVSYKVFNPYYSSPEVKLFCKVQFILNNGGKFSWDCCSDEEDWMTVREMITQVAFEFSFNAYGETCDLSSNGYIMKCGIHRLYDEDGRKFGLLNQRDWEKELHRAYEVDAKSRERDTFWHLMGINDESWKKIYEEEFHRPEEVDEDGEEDDDDDNEKAKILINPMRRNVERNLCAKVGLAPMDQENVTLTVDQHRSCKASYTVEDKQIAVTSHDGESNEQHECNLFVKDPINGGLMLAAIGKVWMESVPTDMVHGVPLGEGNLRVSITSPRIKIAKLPISTSEAEIVNDAVGEYVGWPRTLVELCTISKTSRDPSRVVDKEAEGTKHQKGKVEKKKLKSQPEAEQRPAFDFGRIHVGLRPLAFYAQCCMKDGRQIECPIPTEIMDSDMPIFLGYDDIYEFITFQEISANCILVYLSYLSECCQRDGPDKQFAFISPTITSPITEHEDEHLRERSNCLVTLLRNTPKGRVYLTPYNIGRHWMLAIIDPWEDHVLWFDPLRHPPRSDFKELIIMALDDWKIEVRARVTMHRNERTTFTVCTCPIQPGNTECGFFVLRYMRDIIFNVDGLSVLQSKEFYTRDDINEVRLEWAQFVNRFIQYGM